MPGIVQHEAELVVDEDRPELERRRDVVAGGTGTFERLRGSGDMEAVYDPDPPRRLT